MHFSSIESIFGSLVVVCGNGLMVGRSFRVSYHLSDFWNGLLRQCRGEESDHCSEGDNYSCRNSSPGASVLHFWCYLSAIEQQMTCRLKSLDIYKGWHLSLGPTARFSDKLRREEAPCRLRSLMRTKSLVAKLMGNRFWGVEILSARSLQSAKSFRICVASRFRYEGSSRFPRTGIPWPRQSLFGLLSNSIRFKKTKLQLEQ